MNMQQSGLPDRESQFAEVLFDLAIRIDGGEAVDLNEFCVKYPQWAKQCGKLLPVLKRLSLLRSQ